MGGEILEEKIDDWEKEDNIGGDNDGNCAKEARASGKDDDDNIIACFEVSSSPIDETNQNFLLGGRFRIRLADGGYYWVRVQATSTTDGSTTGDDNNWIKILDFGKEDQQ